MKPRFFDSLQSKKLVALLKSGAIGVIPTDTIYGISCSALNKASVERAYTVRGRSSTKPFIILIASLDDLARFGIRLSDKTRAFLSSLWPAPISVILPCSYKKFTYLHRGTKSLAFRIPARVHMRSFLKKTGPLITASANPEGEKPAATIARAWRYFGVNLDFYVDAGKKSNAPSSIIRIDGDDITLLRSPRLRELSGRFLFSFHHSPF